MTTKTNNKKTYQVQSVDRVFSILQCFSLRKPELSLPEICELTGLPKPSVFRFLAVLETARFIERTPDGQKYRVGIRAFELGSIFLAHVSVEHLARSFMEHLTEHYGMSCNLAIFDQGQVVYIATTDPLAPMRYNPIIGYRHYVHCSALGKALIAALPSEEILAILKQRGMPALAPNTITNPDALLRNLKQVRENGYALDNQEGGIGVCCIAVPIYNHLGQVAAAMSLSGPSPRFTSDTMSDMAHQLKESALQISQRLGWQAQSNRASSRFTAAVRGRKGR
ncbi:MAG: IclR family transcriptional regulator [Chloroflexi bacterium]|nr:IclR family transcriptional regulator [Chloroflexota bacterium]